MRGISRRLEGKKRTFISTRTQCAIKTNASDNGNDKSDVCHVSFSSVTGVACASRNGDDPIETETQAKPLAESLGKAGRR